MKSPGSDTARVDQIALRGESIEQSPKRTQIAAKARANKELKFNNLMHHLTYELVEECLRAIPKSSAPGVDGISKEEVLENLTWLLPPILKQIHSGRYRAPPVRRVLIPKANGGNRPIGVPTILDRALQAAMARVLNEIYEQDFLPGSFGFRAKLGCHNALATIGARVRKWYLWTALEVDIRDFFGSLDHGWMMRFLEHRISDQRVLSLIKSWLKAGVLQEGKWLENEKGTPQGGSISPLLANVYLHYVLDLWIEKKVKPQRTGIWLDFVRYADDFVLLFRKTADANAVKRLLCLRLAQFGLSISEEKTHISRLGPKSPNDRVEKRSITFLGFEIFLQTKRLKAEGVKIVYRTERRRYGRALAASRLTIKRMMHRPVGEQAKRLNALLRGHFNYYGMAGNCAKLSAFRQVIVGYWRRCLSRRSQHGRIKWERMNELLAEHHILTARVHVNYNKLSELARQ
jgi:RNA-directed DNA polymerase